MFKSRIDSKLEAEIAFLLEELETCRDNPEKYATNVDRIAKLEKLTINGAFFSASATLRNDGMP